MTDEELFNDSAAHATVLAKALGKTEETGEITMSVTDAKLAALALRHYAAWLDANG